MAAGTPAEGLEPQPRLPDPRGTWVKGAQPWFSLEKMGFLSLWFVPPGLLWWLWGSGLVLCWVRVTGRSQECFGKVTLARLTRTGSQGAIRGCHLKSEVLKSKLLAPGNAREWARVDPVDGAAWAAGRWPCPWPGDWNQLSFKDPFNPNLSVFLGWFLDTEVPPDLLGSENSSCCCSPELLLAS